MEFFFWNIQRRRSSLRTGSMLRLRGTQHGRATQPTSTKGSASRRGLIRHFLLFPFWIHLLSCSLRVARCLRIRAAFSFLGSFS